MIFVACSLKDHAYFLFLNSDIKDIEKADGICLPTFAVNKLSK